MSLFPNREIKTYVNSFLCPICKCGLDGIPRNFDGYETISLYCVFNRNHFRKEVIWSFDKEPIVPKQIKDVLVLDTQRYRYTLERWYLANHVIKTDIYWLPIDGDGNVPERAEGNKIAIDEDCFDFNNLDKEKILDKLELILMFH